MSRIAREFVFPVRLRDARIDADMSQEQVGKLLGVSHAMVSGYESNASQMTVYQFFKLCDELNLSGDILMGFGGKGYVPTTGLTDEQGELLQSIAAKMRKQNKKKSSETKDET